MCYVMLMLDSIFKSSSGIRPEVWVVGSQISRTRKPPRKDRSRPRCLRSRSWPSWTLRLQGVFHGPLGRYWPGWYEAQRVQVSLLHVLERYLLSQRVQVSVWYIHGSQSWNFEAPFKEQVCTIQLHESFGYGPRGKFQQALKVEKS